MADAERKESLHQVPGTASRGFCGLLRKAGAPALLFLLWAFLFETQLLFFSKHHAIVGFLLAAGAHAMLAGREGALFKSLGGTEKYGNLVLVLAPVHELIHATNKSTIDSSLSSLKLNQQQLAKLNKLRILAEVKPIELEEVALENQSHNGMTKEIKKTV